MGLLNGELAEIIGDVFSDIFLDAVLTRDVFTPSPDYETFDPPIPSQTTYTCKAMRDSYGLGYLRDSLVQSGDVKILILQTSLSVDPLPGDRITITGQGGPWSIVPANTSGQAAVSADPADATWEVRARS